MYTHTSKISENMHIAVSFTTHYANTSVLITYCCGFLTIVFCFMSFNLITFKNFLLICRVKIKFSFCFSNYELYHGYV
jgi:hypothetical protein